MAELIRRISLVDVARATTDLDEVLALVSCGATPLVVISTAQPAARQALIELEAVAAAGDATVSTVLVVPPDKSWWSTDVHARATAVVTTDDGIDGLSRAVFEARQTRRSALRSAHRPRPSASTRRPGSGRPTLTPRELEVLQGIVDGLASKHIAERLGVSVHTVRTHVQRLLPKLGAHTRLRATAVALEEGLVARPGASRPASRYATTAEGARSAGTAD